MLNEPFGPITFLIFRMSSITEGNFITLMSKGIQCSVVVTDRFTIHTKADFAVFLVYREI